MSLHESDRRVIKDITDAVLKRIALWAFFYLAAVGVLGAVADAIRGYDSTDYPSEYVRSGLKLRTDYGTCIQYLETKDGGLTPRVGIDGKPVMVAGCRP